MATPTIPPIRSPFSNGKPGLVPAPNGAVGFLKSDGTFETPTSEAAGYTEAANFDALPEASTVSGEIYAVLAPQGVPFISRKPAGYYRSDGESWTYLGDLSDPYFNDGYLTFSDDADATKKLQFALSDIATETTRTVTWPDKDGTVAMLSDLGGGGFPTGNLVWVDAVNGDDDTGERGRPDKPFLTIEAAVTAAQAGDTVVRLPGEYTINASITKDGVNHFSFAGVKLVLNAVPYADNGSAISMRVQGLEEWSSAATNIAVFRFTNSSSVVSIEAYGTVGDTAFPGFGQNVSYADRFNLRLVQAGPGNFYDRMMISGAGASILADIWRTDCTLIGGRVALTANHLGLHNSLGIRVEGYNESNGEVLIKANHCNVYFMHLSGGLYIQANYIRYSPCLSLQGTGGKRAVLSCPFIRGDSGGVVFESDCTNAKLYLSGCHFHGAGEPVTSNNGAQTIFCVGGGATASTANDSDITVVGNFTVDSNFA